MPKNTGRGGKGFRSGKKYNTNAMMSRKLVLKEEGQDYAKVIKILGNRRISVLCNDGQTRLAIIPGSFKNKIWINNDDIVLINLCDYQDDKVYVIHKYNPDEGKKLGKLGHLSEKLYEKNEEVNSEIEFVLDEDKDKNRDKDREETAERKVRFADDVKLEDL